MTKNRTHIIGIAGPALVGKDTLCNAMIKTFKVLFNLNAVRSSIAGDIVRADLKEFILDKFGINIQSPTNEEKTLIRPIMVQYGRVQRQVTNGRYFIDRFQASQHINIIPDIRYAEYEQDELQWLKNERSGFLVYLERDGIENANIYEEENNKIIKDHANIVLKWPTFTDSELPNEPLIYSKLVIEEWFKNVVLDA